VRGPQRGLAIGLYNSAYELHGVQIGLVREQQPGAVQGPTDSQRASLNVKGPGSPGPYDLCCAVRLRV
jgi:hypothetical protein